MQKELFEHLTFSFSPEVRKSHDVVVEGIMSNYYMHVKKGMSSLLRRHLRILVQDAKMDAKDLVDLMTFLREKDSIEWFETATEMMRFISDPESTKTLIRRAYLYTNWKGLMAHKGGDEELQEKLRETPLYIVAKELRTCGVDLSPSASLFALNFEDFRAHYPDMTSSDLKNVFKYLTESENEELVKVGRECDLNGVLSECLRLIQNERDSDDMEL
jgi:hypothetical protein